MTTTTDSVRRIDVIAGTGMPLRGGDIDTDRIMPARYLRAVSFEGLEAHVFEDDRKAPYRGGSAVARDVASPAPHPFSDARYAGASVLIVNKNFGCGSSREHAPQGLMRWGIRAVVGESFSEIFFGNAIALGVPCVAAPTDVVQELQNEVERDPTQVLTLRLSDLAIELGDKRWRVSIPAAARHALTTGLWDGTGLLLERFDEVRQTADRLPYMRAFSD